MSVVAASPEPPANPAAIGIALSIWISAPRVHPVHCCNRGRGAVGEVSFTGVEFGCRALQGDTGPGLRKLQRVFQVDTLEDGLNIVVAIPAAAEHVEVEVNLGIRSVGDGCGHDSNL